MVFPLVQQLSPFQCYLGKLKQFSHCVPALRYPQHTQRGHPALPEYYSFTNFRHVPKDLPFPHSTGLFCPHFFQKGVMSPSTPCAGQESDWVMNVINHTCPRSSLSAAGNVFPTRTQQGFLDVFILFLQSS